MLHVRVWVRRHGLELVKAKIVVQGKVLEEVSHSIELTVMEADKFQRRLTASSRVPI